MQTSNMTVDNVGFLLEKLSGDCAPTQFIRELTQNALDAILRLLNLSGDVQWDVAEYFFKYYGVLKLCIWDTGIGMSGGDMLQYLNNLSSSGGHQSLSSNYGLGAKISALTRNKAGIIYASWQHKDDPGSMVWLWRDPVSGEYGLKRQETEEGWKEVCVPPDEMKPEKIKKVGHGTVVILLGNTDEQNTFAPVNVNTEWVARYLEERYFKFPKGVTVRARDSKAYVATAEHGSNRPVYGREYALKDISKQSGQVVLFDGSIVHWWILDNAAKAHSTRRFTGYTAALYQNELYEPTIGASSRPRLQNFGCVFSHSQVVLFVEPRATNTEVHTTNTARTNLLLAGEPLPWDVWADDFREKIPQEIKELEGQVAAETIKSNSPAMLERLKNLLPFFKLSRFRPISTNGTQDITVIEETGDNGKHGNGDGKGRKKGRKKGHEDPNVPADKGGKLKFGVIAKEGNTAQEYDSKKIPTVNWVHDLDESLIDRAALYVPKVNLIQANSLFTGFTDIVNYFKTQYLTVPGVGEKIVEVVRESFAQQLSETIMGLQSLKNRQHWTEEQVAQAWSPEALTTAVMAKTQVLAFTRASLARTLGKSGKAEAASV